MVVGAEVLIERESTGFIDIAPVGVKALMGGWFRFPYILVKGAFEAISQVYAAPMAEVEQMSDVELLFGSVT